MAKNWIAGAIKHPGALRKTAKKAGMVKGDEPLTHPDLEKLKARGGKTAKRAALAETLGRLRRKG